MFYFLVDTGFTMQAFASAVEVLRVARKLGASKGFDFSVISMSDQAVVASNGIELLPNHRKDQLKARSTIIVVAGAGAAKSLDAKLSAQLRRWNRAGHPIWAISSGVVRLAQAGLLDGSMVAAHWEDVPYLAKAYPKVQLSSSLFVANDQHATCSGGAAAADLMLHCIACSEAKSLVHDIAACLMMDGVRNGRMRQSMPATLRFGTSNKTVFAALRIMEANRFDAVSISEVATQVGVSLRQLERLFQADFGKTPKQVYLELRLTEARQEVLAGYRTITDIAQDFGFDRATFRKVYKRIFGVLPSQDQSTPTKAMS